MFDLMELKKESRGEFLSRTIVVGGALLTMEAFIRLCSDQLEDAIAVVALQPKPIRDCRTCLNSHFGAKHCSDVFDCRPALHGIFKNWCPRPMPAQCTCERSPGTGLQVHHAPSEICQGYTRELIPLCLAPYPGKVTPDGNSITCDRKTGHEGAHKAEEFYPHDESFHTFEWCSDGRDVG